MNYNEGYTLIENLVSLSLISVVLFPLVLFFIRQEKLIVKIKKDLIIERSVYDYLLNNFKHKLVEFELDSIYKSQLVLHNDFESFELTDKSGRKIFEKKIIR